MEVKKSPQADLENKKNIFLEIGLMLAGYLFYSHSNGKFPGVNPLIRHGTEIPTEIEMVPITMMHRLPHLLPQPRSLSIYWKLWMKQILCRTIWISSMQMTKVIIKNLST